MSWNDLPHDLQLCVSGLTADAEFQDRFGHDPILDELDVETLNLDDVNGELELLFNGSLEIEGRRWKPMTLAVWSKLWALQSPFVTRRRRTHDRRNRQISMVHRQTV